MFVYIIKYVILYTLSADDGPLITGNLLDFREDVFIYDENSNSVLHG